MTGSADGPWSWPSWVLDRARQRPPAGLRVVSGSTPVVSFGPPTGPLVASLGINPSRVLDRRDQLLGGSKRRLATIASLAVDHNDPLDDDHAWAVVDDCARYFQSNPYRRWFNPLDRVLGTLGVSFYDRTASHLDLVQWATNPVWGDLDARVRKELLDADLPFLHRQLTDGGWRVVVINGRTVMDWVQAAGLDTWDDAAVLPGPPRSRVAVSETAGVLLVGWSANLQSQPGALSLIPDLGATVAELVADRLRSEDL